MAQWIKPGINIDFYGSRKRFWGVSIAAVVLSLCVLIANWAVRGEALNYGTDFKGGSQIQVQFSRPTKIGDVRSALTKGASRAPRWCVCGTRIGSTCSWCA